MPRFVNARTTVLRDLLVDAGQDLRQRFEDRDLGADVDEERRELAADRAAADRPRRARDTVELEHVIGRQHALAVELEARTGERARRRPVASDDVACRAPRCRRTRDRAAVGRERAGAGDDRDLAALQQRLEAASAGRSTSCLRAWVSRGRASAPRLCTPNSAALLHRAQHLGGLQQLLGRDAAAVQARAADPPLLDHRDVQAGGRAVERGRVAAGAAPRTTRSNSLGHASDHPLQGSAQ